MVKKRSFENGKSKSVLGKLKEWVIRNRKVLYWPLGGFIYVTLFLIFESTGQSGISKLMANLLYVVGEVVNIICHTLSTSCNIVLFSVIMYLLIGTILTLMGIVYQRLRGIKRKIVVAAAVIVLIILYIIGWSATRIIHAL